MELKELFLAQGYHVYLLIFMLRDLKALLNLVWNNLFINEKYNHFFEFQFDCLTYQ